MKEKQKCKLEETRFKTSDLKEMLGKYLASDLQRHYQEDFLDKDTGEVVTLDRCETIATRGELIDNNLCTQINFLMQCGEIDEVEVSDQKRCGSLMPRFSTRPFNVKVLVNGKKRSVICFAKSIHTALDIVSDYMELNYSVPFDFVAVKECSDCYYIDTNMDSLKKIGGDNVEDKDEHNVIRPFYMVNANITRVDMAFNQYFLLRGKDVDECKAAIENYISKLMKEKLEKDPSLTPEEVEFTVTITEANTSKCAHVVDMEFSAPYNGAVAKQDVVEAQEKVQELMDKLKETFAAEGVELILKDEEGNEVFHAGSAPEPEDEE